ncbi:MAG: hypothetical protein ACE5PV_08385 [Candidatus Poribacteria bacterium]
MYEELDYEDDRIAHIAEHGVDIEEVYEVWEGNRLMSKWEKDRRRVYGRTDSGRYLVIIVGRRRLSRKSWLITAREKKNYRRRMRR